MLELVPYETEDPEPPLDGSRYSDRIEFLRANANRHGRMHHYWRSRW